jgi:hypothetical protein
MENLHNESKLRTVELKKFKLIESYKIIRGKVGVMFHNEKKDES